MREGKWLEHFYGQALGPPSKFHKLRDGWVAIWYSGKGRRDSFSATLVQFNASDSSFEYTEYMDFRDATGEDAEEGRFMVQSIVMPLDVVSKLLFLYGRKDDTPAGRFIMPTNPRDIARWIVGLGSAYISYYGGDEDWAQSLP